MGRKQKELRIGATDYKLRTLGAEQGSELWLDLLHLIAAPIQSLAKDKEYNETALLGGVAAALTALDHATARKFYAAFGPVTTIRVSASGEDRWPTLEGVVFDDHFAGNYVEMTEWLVQSVVFNFFGFFADGSLASHVERLQAMIPSTFSTT